MRIHVMIFSDGGLRAQFRVPDALHVNHLTYALMQRPMT